MLISPTPLLDEVSTGKFFSVLDLSQGFFQQNLMDPKETTSFPIPDYGQWVLCTNKLFHPVAKILAHNGATYRARA